MDFIFRIEEIWRTFLWNCGLVIPSDTVAGGRGPWISITKKLPDCDGLYQTFYGKENAYGAAKFSHGVWTDWGITHWRLLVSREG